MRMMKVMKLVRRRQRKEVTTVVERCPNHRDDHPYTQSRHVVFEHHAGKEHWDEVSKEKLNWMRVLCCYPNRDVELVVLLVNVPV